MEEIRQTGTTFLNFEFFPTSDKIATHWSKWGGVKQLRKKIPVYPGAHYPKVRDHSMFVIHFVCKSNENKPLKFSLSGLVGGNVFDVRLIYA